MGFLKTLNDRIVQGVNKLNSKMKIAELEQSIRHENDYRIMYEDIKKKKLYNPSKLVRAYKFDRTISKDVYDKNIKKYERLFNDLVKEVEDGQMTYTEFIKKWSKATDGKIYE